MSNTITACIRNSAEAVEATITDARAEVITTLQSLDEVRQHAFVTDAWRIGVGSILSAHRLAEEARLADVGRTMLNDITRELDGYVEKQNAAFVQELRRYFDPTDGQVARRIDGFVKDGGDLSRAMEKFLAPEHGALARTLAHEVGENSVLLKRLSPTDNEGIVQVLEGRVQTALDQNNKALEVALDPLAENGAVARFLRALRSDMEKSDGDREKQLTLVTKALDANDEGSLLSRMMREVQTARLTFAAAVNPDDPASPMAVIKSSLISLLEANARTQAEAMAAFDERQQKLATDIRESVTRLEERRRNESRSPRGGDSFEDDVSRFVQRALQGAAVVVDATGDSVGACPNCKVGDQVLRFTEESIFAGSALVIEAKHDASYSVSSALKELEVARKNRSAHVGLFVMARSHAPAGFPALARYGNDILVVWDPDGEHTDAYFHAAIILGLALCCRHQRPSDDGNIEALADIEHRISHELNRLGKMRTLAERIRRDAESLGEEIRKGGDKLNLLLRNAKETLKALNVELAAAEDEKAEPLIAHAMELSQSDDGSPIAAE